MMGEVLGRLAEELVEHSSLLLEAILRQDPGYLEHLANRQEVLERIRKELGGECGSEELYQLGRALEMGAEAASGVRQARRQAWLEFTALRQEHDFADALRTQTGGYQAALDVEA